MRASTSSALIACLCAQTFSLQSHQQRAHQHQEQIKNKAMNTHNARSESHRPIA
jgi:hypothetical protein